VAPPKRKGGGRVTPKGTRPGDATNLSTAAASGPISSEKAAHHATQASKRYTPPVPKYETESPRWVPIVMFGLLLLGALVIMSYYLIKPMQQNYVLLIGLGGILGGLYTATKWK
jgi:Cell division protein CrgA